MCWSTHTLAASVRPVNWSVCLFVCLGKLTFSLPFHLSQSNLCLALIKPATETTAQTLSAYLSVVKCSLAETTLFDRYLIDELPFGGISWVLMVFQTETNFLAYFVSTCSLCWRQSPIERAKSNLAHCLCARLSSTLCQLAQPFSALPTLPFKYYNNNI